MFAGLSRTSANGTWCERHEPSSLCPPTSEGLVHPFGVRRTIIGHATREGIDRALRDYLRMVATPAVDWTVTVHGDQRKPSPALLDELYLILREAARNALVHAEARHLVITVDVRADDVAGTVTDDGRGFDSAAHPGTGGLTAMRERAEAHDGSLVVSSKAGAGTVVQVHVPLPATENNPPDQQ